MGSGRVMWCSHRSSLLYMMCLWGLSSENLTRRKWNWCLNVFTSMKPSSSLGVHLLSKLVWLLQWRDLCRGCMTKTAVKWTQLDAACFCWLPKLKQIFLLPVTLCGNISWEPTTRQQSTQALWNSFLLSPVHGVMGVDCHSWPSLGNCMGWFPTCTKHSVGAYIL